MGCILPQLEFDRSGQGRADPKNSCQKQEKSHKILISGTSTLGTSVSMGLVKRKAAKGKLARVKLLKKFMPTL